MLEGRRGKERERGQFLEMDEKILFWGFLDICCFCKKLERGEKNRVLGDIMDVLVNYHFLILTTSSPKSSCC